MTKNDADGVFAAMGRAADDSLEIVSLIRAGKLTRHRFEAWYTQRRAEGEGLVMTLRAKASGLAEPLESVIVQGEKILSSVAPRAAKHPAHHRRTLHKAKSK
jgi:hypothetical protein